MKRQRGDSLVLTGGTGDVNPQLLSDSAAQSAADTTTTSQLVLPIQRIATNAPNQSVVMEVLKIFVQFPAFGAIANVAEVAENMTCAFGTRNASTTALTLSDPSVIWMAQVRRQGAFTAGGTYGYIEDPCTVTVDLTDGAGHGVLVATDSLFIQVGSANTGQTVTARFKILYRWKRVGLAEYIGLVQSQQQ